MENERTATGIIYRARLLIQIRKNRRSDEAFLEVLQSDKRILVERLI